MLFGTNLKHTKAYNYRIVLETVRLYGPIPRSAIARRTELTAQTVSNITRKLLELNLICEGDRVQDGRGAPKITLELNPEGAFAIGLDLDKDHLTGVLVDFKGHVRHRIRHDLSFPPPDVALDLLTETAQKLMASEGVQPSQVSGVGVGFPGPLVIDGGTAKLNAVNPKAFPGWDNVPVVDLLNERLSLPVYLENNATAAAIGERWYGAGQHIDTFFYVFFGVGLGGGLILNGHPYAGFTGNAGELGFIPIADRSASPDNAPPHLGLHFNLPRLYRALEQHGIVEPTSTQLGDLYHQRHPVLVAWLEQGTQLIAPTILAIEYLLDPKAIFFGGRLPEVLIKALLDRLNTTLPTLRILEKPSTPDLLLATSGEDAAALGVATLPMYASFAPAHNVLVKGNGTGRSHQAMQHVNNEAFTA